MLMGVIYGFEVAFWVAFTCSAVGVLCRDRAALALCLASTVAVAIEHFGITFDTWSWVALDVATAWMIIRPGMGKRDILIVALFAPCWAAYLLNEPWRYMAATGIVVVQLMVTTPHYRTVIRRARAVDMRDIFGEFMHMRRGG